MYQELNQLPDGTTENYYTYMAESIIVRFMFLFKKRVFSHSVHYESSC